MSNNNKNALLINFGHCKQTIENLSSALGVYKKFNITISNYNEALSGLDNSKYNCIVLLGKERCELSNDQLTNLQNFVEAGGGLVVCHKALQSLASNHALTDSLGVEPEKNESPSPFYFHLTVDENADKSGHPLAVRSEGFTVFDNFLSIKTNHTGKTFITTHMNHITVPAGVSNVTDNTKTVYLAPGGTKETLENRYYQRLLMRAMRFACGETGDSFTKTINAGIIGYGGAFNMGRRHGLAINDQHGMNTVAVCDLDTSRFAQAKEDLGDVATYKNSDDLLNDPNVDLAIVILPHNLHAKTCIAASKAGKHVVTEKPFCITLQEADQMIEAANENNTMVSCFHNRRWDGDFLKILEIVRRGDIGDVYHIDASTANWAPARKWWRSDKSKSGGVLYDWGAHYTDWIFNLMPKKVASVSGNIQKHSWHNATIEDFARATIRFEDGTTANLEQGTLAAIKRDGWRILGTRGAISNEKPGGEITVIQRDGASETVSTVTPLESNWAGFYKNIGNHLIMDEPLIVTPQQARRPTGVFELAEKSNNQGGIPLKMAGEDSFAPEYIFPL